ncbi:MAG: histidine--tRNA ligase [Candidatus Diapherotrites archaeon]
MPSKFQTVRGMRDLMPEEARKKQYIEDKFRREAEAYGFEPIETPEVEDFALLTAKGGGGEAIKEDIYYFKDKSGRELGLRFDLTVSLARFIASNPQLPKPFRRYQIGKVYRYDRPGPGRFREFSQADVDIVGSDSILADFECIALAYKILKDLGIGFNPGKGKIRVSNKKLLEEIALASGVQQGQAVECMRVLDKLDKIGFEGVRAELKEKKISAKILDIVAENDLKKIEKLVGEKKGLEELKELLEYCDKAGISDLVQFDASLARGLEYYTGNVFEFGMQGSPSIGGGGRYDGLIALYGGPPTPAVGWSLGVDRLIDLVAKGKAERPRAWKTKTKVLVVPIGLEAGKEALRIAKELRSMGIPTENDLMQRNLQKNLEFASKRGIPFVAIVGENELKEKALLVKELQSGKQFKVRFGKLDELKKIVQGE